jgi:Fe2+ or Zn2+ uptake regulation protein
MNQSVTIHRQTKYCQAVERALSQLGHATNSELLSELRKDYPDLSATTVHRVTTRLAERGAISVAPAKVDGSMRYDSNTSEHDHFMCSSCGILRDTDIRDKILNTIESSIDGCHISGRLTIGGVCKLCAAGMKEK